MSSNLKVCEKLWIIKNELKQLINFNTKWLQKQTFHSSLWIHRNCWRLLNTDEKKTQSVSFIPDLLYKLRHESEKKCKWNIADTLRNFGNKILKEITASLAPELVNAMKRNGYHLFSFSNPKGSIKWEIWKSHFWITYKISQQLLGRNKMKFWNSHFTTDWHYFSSIT